MYREITADDVGEPYFKAFGRVTPVQNFIGRIMKQDIGKRVFLRGDILQVENDEQRDARLAPAPAVDPRLYAVEAEHIERLKAIAKRLYTEIRMNGDEMRDAAHAITSVVWYAEALGPIPLTEST